MLFQQALAFEVESEIEVGIRFKFDDDSLSSSSSQYRSSYSSVSLYGFVSAANSFANLVSGNGIHQLIDAQQNRALEEASNNNANTNNNNNNNNVNSVDDDSIIQIMFNENFTTCNDETMQFYRENPNINQAVQDFGDSANVTWSGPNQLNLLLEFNATLKDQMEEACKNSSSSSSSIFSFSESLDCTYEIEGGTTANASIVGYASCLAYTDACNAVEKIDFLRIIMHSLGSACDGLVGDGLEVQGVLRN